jgi:uncharacterized repeat protein (TIGR01451 family)
MKSTKTMATGGWQLARFGIALALLSASLNAFAQEKNCVSLKTEGQKEEHYTDAQGKAATRLVPPGKVLPGDEIVWTITATNSCAKPAEKVVVNNNVPEHMTYVADSAMGPGATITFSTNGRDFAAQSELTMKGTEGGTRPARADEIKAIRWVIGAPIGINQSAFVRYRAKIQ